MNNFIKILQIKITTNSKQEILEKIEKYVENRKTKTQNSKLKRQKALIIFTPNPEIVVYSQKHPLFTQIVNKAQINIPDGQFLVWGANILGYPIKKRIAGADLAVDLVKTSHRQNVTIGLIGGFNNLALKALECLKQQFPGLKGWAEDGPRIRIRNDYGDWDVNEFIKKVEKRKTKMLFVAFGCPKQEIFIKEIAPRLTNIVIMGVGGTFGYISGRTARAPKLLQSFGLEWFYRLIREPARFFRQLSLLKFIFLVVREITKRDCPRRGLSL